MHLGLLVRKAATEHPITEPGSLCQIQSSPIFVCVGVYVRTELATELAVSDAFF